MEKDLLLLEAAISSDRIVASSDRKVKHLFAIASGQVSSIANIIWVNPTDPKMIVKAGLRRVLAAMPANDSGARTQPIDPARREASRLVRRGGG
jgi:hypothetical protein